LENVAGTPVARANRKNIWIGIHSRLRTLVSLDALDIQSGKAALAAQKMVAEQLTTSTMHQHLEFSDIRSSPAASKQYTDPTFSAKAVICQVGTQRVRKHSGHAGGPCQA